MNRTAISAAGSSAIVIYAGTAAGFPGLDQINLVVPEGTAGLFPIMISSAEHNSPATMLAVATQ